MVCPFCGQPYSFTVRFCPNCGRQFNRPCSACGGLIPHGSNYCPNCGRSLTGNVPDRMPEPIKPWMGDKVGE
jgi:predicted amidophosphoribosyltransferase